MKSIALYLRVSTGQQDVSLQRNDLRRMLEARFHEVPLVEYVDLGQSGAKTNRPALDRMLGDMRHGKLQGIAVWRYDRLGRSLQHLVSLLQEFNERGITFLSYSEGADTSTSTGRLLFNLCASFAQFERELIRERVLSGQAAAKLKGVRFGRPEVPVDTSRARLLRQEGRSWRQIARDLGVPKDTVIRRVNAVTA
jgi:DNA invertase Pin-like site-specific DNA recombinase